MANKTNYESNGIKYFRVTKTIGYDKNNNQIQKSFYGKSKKEADEKANKYMNDLDNGLIIINHNINDLMHYWIYNYLNNSDKIKVSTFSRYEGLYRNYIKNSELAGIKVAKINMIQLQNYYNKLSETKSYTQVKTLNTFLKTFFNWCIDNDYINKNPCTKIAIKGKEKETNKEVEILTEDEIKKILKYIKDTDFEILFALDLTTGLRRGELLALDWSSIDLKNKQLKITQSVRQDYFYEGEEKHIETHFTTPKSKKSIRTVPIPSETYKLLNNIQNKTGLLFNYNGEPLTGKYVSSKWTRILKQCNIPHKKFHAIRHTYGSNLLKNGIDIETVGELMGHSAVTITQIYLHSTKKTKQTAVRSLNKLIKF